MSRRFLILLIVLFSLAALAAQERPGGPALLIRNAIIIDGGPGAPFRGDVLIEAGRIAAVGPSLPLPPGAAVTGAEGKTLLPGLFDLHTHLPYAPVSGFSGGWEKHLLAYLYCGVTSVVDFGVYPDMFEPMRRLVARNIVESPRLHLAARIAPPGGHGLEGGRGDFHTQAVLTPREAKHAIQQLIPYQPDVIKVFNDGWRYGYADDMADMPLDALQTIVEEAHRHGWEVLTHTVTVEQTRNAARARVDVIAHGIGDAEAGADLIELLKQTGTVYAPTLAVYHPKGRDILSPLLAAVVPPEERKRVSPPLVPPANGDGPLVETYRRGPGGDISPRERRWRHLMRNNRKLREANVPFGVGTDAGVANTWHGWATLRELRLLVHGGLTPIEAIRAATSQSAAALHVENERGSIAPGKLADLVLIDGRPHEDIVDIEKVDRVWLGGREIDRPELARRIADEDFSPIPAVRIAPLLDDFELEGRRSQTGTNWVNATDPGHGRSKMLFVRSLRAPGDHALTITARMARKDDPWVSAILPLTPGAVEPADISAFSGVRFDARGDGGYVLMVATHSVRDYNYHRASFEAGAHWTTVEIPFSRLEQRRRSSPVSWTGRDALALYFRIERPSGETAWLEIDNIELYRK